MVFMEVVCSVVQRYGTQSLLKIDLNGPLMNTILDKLVKCERTLREPLVDSATDGSDANSPLNHLTKRIAIK